MNDEETLKVDHLPKPIADKLQFASDRIRRILFLRGLFAVLSISLLTILGVMLIDAATLLFSIGIRWFLSLAALSIIGASIYWHLIRPLKRKLSLSEIARIIETRSENLQDERISSTVEILGRQFKKGEEFSPVLLEQLVKDAQKDADVVLPHQLFTMQSAKRFMVALGVIGFVYLLIFVVWPGPSSRLLVRAVAPFARVGGALSGQLTVTPENIRLAAGDPLTIEVQLDKATTRDVELRTRWEGRPELVEKMQSTEIEGEKQVFSTGFPRVTEGFDYRIRSGHALTSFYRVDVYPRPEISEMTVSITPPPYTGLQAYTEKMSPGKIEALAGSKVKVFIQSNTPMASAHFFLGDDELNQGKIEKVDGHEMMGWDFYLKAPARDLEWRVEMTSLDGFENNPVRSHVLSIVNDEAPDVEILSPVSREVKVPTDGFVTIDYRISDKYGLQQVELVLSPQGHKKIVLTQDAQMTSPGQWTGRFPVQLKSLDLGGASRITVEVVGYDNLPQSLNGPNKGVSESITLILERDAESLAKQQVKGQYDVASASLKTLIAELETLTQEITSLRINLNEQQNDAAMDHAEKARSQGATTEAGMRELSMQLAGGMFDPIAQGITAVADNEMTQIRIQGEKLPLSDDNAEQKNMAMQMYVYVTTALDKVKALEKQTDQMAEAAIKLAELAEMMSQQDALAEEVAADNWEETREEWAEQQAALAEELNEMSAAEEAALDMAEHTSKAADELADAAELADEALQLAEDLEVPPWKLAQDLALTAQKQALLAQENVMRTQSILSKKTGKDMASSQATAEKEQQVADLAQAQAERAQRDALRHLEAGGSPVAIQAQKQANALQLSAKLNQKQADQAQSAAAQMRQQADESEAPDYASTSQQQVQAAITQKQAYEAQKRALERQEYALAVSTPELDQAISDAVAQQQAAEAAQQAALDAQERAESALAAGEDATVAQQEAAAAQQAALDAQKAAMDAQTAAAEAAGTDEQAAAVQAQSEAVDAQQAAANAQQLAESATSTAEQSAQIADQANEVAQQADAVADAAQVAAAESGSAEDQAKAAEAQKAAQLAEQQAAAATEQAQEAQQAATAAQQAATSAQEEAIAKQQVASEAQPQTDRSEAQREALDASQLASDAAAAAAAAAVAAAEAGMLDQAQALHELAQDAQGAAEAMTEAANEPGLPSSNQAMSESAAQMAETAQSLADISAGQELAAPATPSAMADAAAAAQAAAQAATQDTASSQSEAAAQAAAAAAALAQMSQSLAESMGMTAPPSNTTPSPSTPSSFSDPSSGMSNHADRIEDETMPAWVSDIGMTRADWGKMKTLSSSDGEALDDMGIPREYRQLVRDYFLQLSQEQAR
ncbi:hypothetical protein P3T73_10800 [Kiritimatiellota bacterium B12222]|nr:hypothetical protein P3T73_10800 [Kiritimatiellota bacterium B12222]